MADRTRIGWADAAKGVSILLVAFHHAALMTGKLGLGLDYYETVRLFFRPLRMPLFFFIAGLFAAKAVSKSWPQMLSSKVAFYFYLFGLWALVRFGFFRWIAVNPLNPAEGSSPKELLVMWIAPETGLWFLWCLAIYFPLIKMLSRLPRTIALALLMIPAAIVSAGLVHAPVYTLANLVKFAPFFAIGTWYGAFLASRVASSAWSILLGSSVAIVIAALAVLSGGKMAASGQAFLSYACVSAACSMIVIVCRSYNTSFLQYIGRNTLPIYVMHVMFIVTIAYGLLALPSSNLLRIAATPLALVLGTAMSLGAYRVLGGFGRKWLFSIDGVKSLREHFHKSAGGAQADEPGNLQRGRRTFLRSQFASTDESD